MENKEFETQALLHCGSGHTTMRILRAKVTNGKVPQQDKGDKHKSQKHGNHPDCASKLQKCQRTRIKVQVLSASQNDNSVTEDGTKGKEEARASRCAKKKNENKMELHGATQELGNNVHCCGNKRQTEFHNRTTE